MAENDEARTLNSSNCETRSRVSMLKVCEVVISCFFLVASVACATLAFTLFCHNCPWPSSLIVWLSGAASVLLMFAGLTTLFGVLLDKRTRNNSSAEDPVTSAVPARLSKKSLTPILPFIYLPQHQRFVGNSSIDFPDYFTATQYSDGDEASLGNLPDYFSAVQNIDEFYLSLDGDELLIEDGSFPPPSYDKVTEMELRLAATTVWEVQCTI